MNYIYHFIYKTTCLVDGKIYVGVHSTNNLTDGYLGSGKHLLRAVKKHGPDNFTREILEFFSCITDAYLSEASIVTEDFIKRSDTYNIAIGGKGGHTGSYDSPERSAKLSEKAVGKIMTVDEQGVIVKMDEDDERWVSGKVRGVTAGIAVMRDSNGVVVRVNSKDMDARKNLVGVTKGLVMAKHRVTGEKCQVTQKEFDSDEDLVGVSAGSIQSEESNKRRSAKLKGKPVTCHTRVTCLVCRETTILTNFKRWCLKRCHNLA